MTWLPRRRPAGPLIAEDGLDDRLWHYMLDMVVAAQLADVVTFRAAASRMAEYLKRSDVHDQPGLWLFYLVKHHVHAILGQEPTIAEMETLADPYQDAYRKIVYRKVRLIGVLATACEVATDETEVVGTDFWVGAMAALGVIMDDPRRQLEEMRPHLADWYRDTMQRYRG